MKTMDCPWKQGAVFVCEKCGRRDDGAKGNPGAEQFKSDGRSRLREFGLHKDLRVMVSGCLGPCPKDLQTAAYFPPEGEVELVAFDPINERENFYQWIEKRARGR